LSISWAKGKREDTVFTRLARDHPDGKAKSVEELRERTSRIKEHSSGFGIGKERGRGGGKIHHHACLKVEGRGKTLYFDRRSVEGAPIVRRKRRRRRKKKRGGEPLPRGLLGKKKK